MKKSYEYRLDGASTAILSLLYLNISPFHVYVECTRFLYGHHKGRKSLIH